MTLTNSPTVSVTAGQHFIAAPVQLAANVAAAIDGQLEISGAISGSGFGITKTGVGTLICPGANSYSGSHRQRRDAAGEQCHDWQRRGHHRGRWHAWWHGHCGRGGDGAEWGICRRQ